jgi:hypothetical protein
VCVSCNIGTQRATNTKQLDGKVKKDKKKNLYIFFILKENNKIVLGFLCCFPISRSCSFSFTHTPKKGGREGKKNKKHFFFLYFLIPLAPLCTRKLHVINSTHNIHDKITTLSLHHSLLFLLFFLGLS